MRLLTKLRDAIGGRDTAAAAQAQRRLDALTKPPGSLGRLEEIAVRLAAISSARSTSGWRPRPITSR